MLLIPGHLWEVEKPPGPQADTAASSSCCGVQPCRRWSFDIFDCFKDWGILLAFSCTVSFSEYDARGTHIKLFWSGFVDSKSGD